MSRSILVIQISDHVISDWLLFLIARYNTLHTLYRNDTLAFLKGPRTSKAGKCRSVYKCLVPRLVLCYLFLKYMSASHQVTWSTVFSSLHRHLIEHLNAEIVLNTITDVSIALEWLKSTFLYIRILKNPTYYGKSLWKSCTLTWWFSVLWKPNAFRVRTLVCLVAK